MSFSLLDNISLTCLSLGEAEEAVVDQGVPNPSIDAEVKGIDEEEDGEEDMMGLLKLSASEIADFVAEMESASCSPASAVNGLAISARCYDTRPGVASLKACIQLLMSKSQELGEQGVCPYIAKLMKTHGSSVDVAMQAFRCLIGLCKDRKNIQLMEKAGVAYQIVSLLHMHHSNVDVVEWGSNLILEYLNGDQPSSRFLANSLLDEGVFAELLALLDMQNPCSSSTLIVENVCKALDILCPAELASTPAHIDKIHPAIVISDAVRVLDGIANIVQLDREPISESMRALLKSTREHFYSALTNTLTEDGATVSVAHSTPDRKKQPVSSPIRASAAKARDMRISKSDLLNVVTSLLSDSMQTSESSKIRSFDDIFNSSRQTAEAKQQESVSSIPLAPSTNTDSSPPVVDHTMMLAFKNALSAMISDDESPDGEGESEALAETEAEALAGVAGAADIEANDNIPVSSDVNKTLPVEREDISMHSDAAIDDHIQMDERSVPPTCPLKAESHHSVRFDMPVSLKYCSKNKADGNDSLAARRKLQDRSTGNLYFADMQYAMGMAKCASFFDSLAHKEYTTPQSQAGLDDSNSSIFSTFSAVSKLEDGSEEDIRELSDRRLKKCIERFRLTISFDPEHVDAAFALAVLLCSGREKLTAADKEEAEQLFKDIIVLYPEYPKAFYNLGHIFFTRGQYGDSLTCFDSAIEVCNLDMEARVYKALCLTQLGGDENLGDAMAEYRIILSMDATNYLALYNLGVLLLKTNDFSGAIFTFQNILMNDPENVDALYVLAGSFLMRANNSLHDIEGDGSVSRMAGFVPENVAIIEDLRRALRCHEQLLRLDTVLIGSSIYENISKSIQEILRKLRNLCS